MGVLGLFPGRNSAEAWPLPQNLASHFYKGLSFTDRQGPLPYGILVFSLLSKAQIQFGFHLKCDILEQILVEVWILKFYFFLFKIALLFTEVTCWSEISFFFS